VYPAVNASRKWYIDEEGWSREDGAGFAGGGERRPCIGRRERREMKNRVKSVSTRAGRASGEG